MQFLSWLHFSDLHFGMDRQEWWWPTFREQLYKDLSILYEQAGPWDIVLFSGDLAQAGQQSQYDKLNSELDSLWDHFRSLGCAPQFISVPGNHDLMRPPSSSAVVKALQQWNKDKEIRNLFWSSNPNEYRDLVCECFSAYSSWVQNLALPKPQTYSSGFLPGDFSTIVEKRGLRLGVIGMNTAFLQLTDDDYKGFLDIHEKQIHGACSNDPSTWCKNNHISLLMTHHGYKWLNTLAQQRLLSEISPPGRFFAHIYGHMHDPYSSISSEMGAEVRRYFQGPSLFGLKTFGQNEERLHGYTSYKIEIEESDGRLYIWPRGRIQALAGHYRIAPDQRYDLTPTNCIVETFELTIKGSDLEKNTVCKSQITTIKQDDVEETADGAPELLTEGGDLDLIGAMPIEQDKAKAKLLKVPRLLARGVAYHNGIRQEEQSQLEALLRHDRCSWLISDWGLGKTDFLGCIFNRFKKEDVLPDVYYLKCDDSSSIEDFLNAFDEQFGLSFQEFFSLNSVIPFSFLVLDNIPLDLIDSTVAGQNGNTFEELIKSFLDYCPSICIILISRQIPRQSRFDFVALKPLQLPDVRNYLLAHPDSEHALQDADFIEKLFMKSGGLPMHLDRFIKMLKITTLNELLDLEAEVTTEDSSEPIPKSLKQTVASLSQSNNQYSRRSYRLLKVLTVLSYGETLSVVRRFYHTEPFFPDNAFELEELSLIEIVPLFTPADGIDNYRGSYLLSQADTAKLLRVPKQVRDYIRLLITDEEYSDIIRRSADMLFGPRWREGRIKLSQMAKLGRKLAKPLGPGNEHTVALHLLREALQMENARTVKQAARLCIDYCRNLYKCHRYKDTCLAAEEIYYVLLDKEYPKEIIDIAVIYGESLRMMGKRKEAIEVFQIILDQKKEYITKTMEIDINLELALAYENDDESALAVAAAEKVLALAKKESAGFLHAKSIILRCQGSDDEATMSLIQLERKAHQKNFVILSNNILLDLVSRIDDVEKQLSIIERILNSSKDDYNHFRAIVKKVEIILNKNRSSISISQRDRHLLCLAYTYLYYQRLTGLFNRCHNVLWTIMKQENATHYLLRVFRHSSFLWRILGDTGRENKYLRELDSIDVHNFKRPEIETLGADLKYLELRRQAQSPSIID